MNTKNWYFILPVPWGYIAQPGDDLNFLDKVQREGEDYGYTDFTATVDIVIMGRRTYDWIMARCPEYVHHDKNTYIITRTERPQQENTQFYTGDLKELVTTLKLQGGKNIFCDGGAEVVNELLKDRLFDELIISIIPVLLGDGTKLFRNGVPMQDLILVSSKSFDSSLVQLHYKVY